MTATQTLKIYQVLNKHFKSDDQQKEILAMKEDIARNKLAVENSFNNLVLWIVSTGIAVIGLLPAFLKL